MKSAYVILFLFFVGLTTARAQTFTSLLSFDGSDGAFPQGSLVEGAHGAFYGATPFGGEYDAGTVFEITAKGKLTTLYSFCSQPNCADGGLPYAGLIRTRTGNLYGVTAWGGVDAGLYGTVFEITPTGKLTTLYSFCSRSSCTDGKTPYGGLAEGSNGNFYGMTYSGGAHNGGTIFEVTPTGELTTLYSFCSETNCSDGEAPLLASLVLGRKGNLYGTTPTGGSHGWGTVFEITPGGKLTTLYDFCSQPTCTDGAYPFAGLMAGSNGNFYGTTANGGAHNEGTIFEITAKGKLTTLYSFCSQPNCADGGAPYAGLVRGKKGNFYGTTYSGAYGHRGTVFEVTPKGKLTTLYRFCAQPGCVDGLAPVAGLMKATSGKLYGTTFLGGAYGTNECGSYGNYGCGTLFRLTVEPPLEH